MGKTSVNRIRNCGRNCFFDDLDACALVRYVRKNRRATLRQVTENVNAGCDQAVSSRTVRQQLHREGYYSRVAVHKPLIIKTNAHLRVQWFKNRRLWSTKMQKKCWPDESSFTIFSTSGREHVWHTQRELYRSVTGTGLTPTVRGSGGSVMLNDHLSNETFLS